MAQKGNGCAGQRLRQSHCDHCALIGCPPFPCCARVARVCLFSPVEDDLQPDEEGMAKYSSLITKFASDARELGSAAQAEIEPVVRKRKAAGADGDDSKRVKKEDPDYDSIDWKQQLENDTVRRGDTGKGAAGTATGRLAAVASSCRS